MIRSRLFQRGCWLLLALVAAVALGGCRHDNDRKSASAAASSANARVATSASNSARGPRTTPGHVAVQNLDSQIRGTERLAAQFPKNIRNQVSLIELLLDRGSFLGRIADLEKAFSIADKLVQDHPEDPKVIVVHARTLATFHQFDQALNKLEKASALGERAENLIGLRAAALEGLGRFDEALVLRQQMRERRTTLSTLGTEAGLLGEMGKVGEADKLFEEALHIDRDLTAFSVAWIYFQQGTMWERAGRLTRAKELFTMAHQHLPLYAHAAAHLATLESPERAIELLTPIVKLSDDPQYMGQLAEAMRLAKQGDGGELIEAARKRYDELLVLHPLAFADHAGWFWLGSGNDVGKAVILAKGHVKHRPIASSYELWIEAERQAGQQDKACEAANQAMALRYPTLKLLDIAYRVFTACSKQELAEAAKRSMEAREGEIGNKE